MQQGRDEGMTMRRTNITETQDTTQEIKSRRSQKKARRAERRREEKQEMHVAVAKGKQEGGQMKQEGVGRKLQKKTRQQWREETQGKQCGTQEKQLLSRLSAAMADDELEQMSWGARTQEHERRMAKEEVAGKENRRFRRLEPSEMTDEDMEWNSWADMLQLVDHDWDGEMPLGNGRRMVRGSYELGDGVIDEVALRLKMPD